ncbi:MAG: hypothetical protein K0V04_00150 [Deltaproteobacteria bacterium]|nr:hypothetical protein [Deltaproteobacteria bacterium]
MRYGLALFPRLLVIVAVLGFAVAAQAAPTPVKPKAAKPTPVKPRTVKPAGQKPTPVKASGQKPAKVQPKSGAKPAATRATKKIDPFEGNPSDSGNPSNANVRESELYGDRLDSLQADVDQLKDKIFRSKARLTLLKETVLRGVLAGSRVTVTHQNLMGSGFRLTRVVFIMDGAQIFARTDETGSLDGEDEVLVYDGNLPPGPHNVTVELTYQGNGYGVFSYLNGYTFESRSSHSFTAPENAAIKLVSQGFERGNMTTEMGDRPAVNWQEVPLDAAGRPLPKARNDKARAVKAKKDNR